MTGKLIIELGGSGHYELVGSSSDVALQRAKEIALGLLPTHRAEAWTASEPPSSMKAHARPLTARLAISATSPGSNARRVPVMRLRPEVEGRSATGGAQVRNRSTSMWRRHDGAHVTSHH